MICQFDGFNSNRSMDKLSNSSLRSSTNSASSMRYKTLRILHASCLFQVNFLTLEMVLKLFQIPSLEHIFQLASKIEAKSKAGQSTKQSSQPS
jgi:hypothetical protein